jgi:hypothetical protein
MNKPPMLRYHLGLGPKILSRKVGCQYLLTVSLVWIGRPLLDRVYKIG